MPSLNWIGKDKVINHHQFVPFRVLEHRYGYTSEHGQQPGKTNSGNMIIHGDNLEALKALLPRYECKIKCIYIDPPYNTGNEKWVYNDNVNDPRLKKWLGQVVGKESEDLSRHDKWLCMMYPRLKLLHKLLANDGAIFISIDDNEQANLKLVCDEIFGPGNFLGNIVWKKKTNGNNMGHIPSVHDFFVCYAKRQDQLNLPGIPLNNDYLAKNYSNPDDDPRGDWKTMDLSANHPGPYFEIENPQTGQRHLPPKGRYWVFNEKEVKRRIIEGRIIFGKSGKARPVQKVFLNERNVRKKPESWWDKHGYNSDGMLELSTILGTKKFDHPKPSVTIKHILDLATNENDIVLDSFAGSGTTAHAVSKLNQHGGNRKFILIEMEEYAESITAERVKRVMRGYGRKGNATKGLGGKFDYYELGEPLFIGDNQEFLNEAIPTAKIREYVFYSETQTPIATDFLSKESKYYLGIHNGASYYLIYEKNRLTTLDYEFLPNIKTKAEQYIIYADNCLLPQDFICDHNIIFKKIPRDITRF